MVKIQLSTNFCAEQPPGGTARLGESEDNENMGYLSTLWGAEPEKPVWHKQTDQDKGKPSTVVCTCGKGAPGFLIYVCT